MTKRTVEIESFAKVKPRPARHRRREDGYHLLRSIFQTVDWRDSLKIEIGRGRGSLELCGDSPLVPVG
jgi:4-diphosphocytidyl-2C-methyl-D-erythritol kinase